MTENPANRHAGPSFWTSPMKAAHVPPGTPLNARSLHLVVGVDGHSAGLSIWSWNRTGGQWPAIRLEGSWRWRDVPLTTEECVVYAYQALQAYAAEQGIQLP